VADRVVPAVVAAATGAGDRLDEAALAELGRRDVLRGRRVRTEAGVMGAAEGIAPDGGLSVRDGSGVVHTVRAGGVEAIDEVGAP